MPCSNKTGAWDTAVPLDLDAQGWPTRLPPNTIAHKLTLRNVQQCAMPGRYVCTFEGEGQLDFQFDSKVGGVELGAVGRCGRGSQGRDGGHRWAGGTSTVRII